MSRRDLVAALNRAMREASGQGVLYSQAVAERLGINSTDLECLDSVVLRGPLTAGELADATGLTTGAITGVIDRLERAGFARRERDRHDRRKILVRALPAVERVIVPLFQPMSAPFCPRCRTTATRSLPCCSTSSRAPATPQPPR